MHAKKTHRGPGAVRPVMVPGMNLVAEIAHEQYGSALFIPLDQMDELTVNKYNMTHTICFGKIQIILHCRYDYGYIRRDMIYL